MGAKDFIQLLDNPQEVEKLPVDELKKLSLEYPYSQPVQLLYATRLSQSSEYLFSKQLAKTSILTDDRTVLFDLFEREKEEVGTTTVISQTTDIEKNEVVETEPLISQLEASIKPEPMKEIEPEPEGEVKPEPVVAKPDFDHKPAAEVVVNPAQPDVKKEALKQKLDLNGLSPKEKVKAILAENKRIREEMTSKKIGEQVESPDPEEIPTEKIEEKDDLQIEQPLREEPVDESISAAEQHSIKYFPPSAEYTYDEPKVPEEVGELPNPVNALDPVSEVPFDVPLAAAAVKDQAAELKEWEGETSVGDELKEPIVQPEAPIIFTIDEEVKEPIFKIEEEEPYNLPVKNTVNAKQEPLLEQTIDYSSEKHSFAEWLQILKNKETKEEIHKEPAEIPAKDKSKLPLEKKIELLDSFVEKLPEIKRKNLHSPGTEKPEISLGKYGGENDDMLVTETLAKVYISQKHYTKAIKAFEILKLKYPEKNAFFADQISEVRNLINSK